MIFDISPSKSGTVSLAAALRVLGYNTCHGCPADMAEDCIEHMLLNDYRRMEVIQRHDAVVNLFNFAYLSLEMQFPDAKFIYLDRDPVTWAESTCRQLQVNPQDSLSSTIRDPFVYGRLLNLGCLHTLDREYLIETVKRHRRNVLWHFSDAKVQKLLMMDISAGWGPLCSFLNKPVPTVPFPWLNRSES